MKTVLIADSHALCREALCDYLRHAGADMDILGAGDYEALCLSIKSGQPDLVLVDRELLGLLRHDLKIRIPSRTRLGWIYSDLEKTHEEIKEDEETWGLFPKTMSCKEFLEGIEHILAGQRYEPKVNENFPAAVEYRSAERFSLIRDFNLTNREKQVLEYLVKGASNKDIARALDLQVVTVKLHVRGICRKMAAANRTQAALMAKENGWG